MQLLVITLLHMHVMVWGSCTPVMIHFAVLMLLLPRPPFLLLLLLGICSFSLLFLLSIGHTQGHDTTGSHTDAADTITDTIALSLESCGNTFCA